MLIMLYEMRAGSAARALLLMVACAARAWFTQLAVRDPHSRHEREATSDRCNSYTWQPVMCWPNCSTTPDNGACSVWLVMLAAGACPAFAIGLVLSLVDGLGHKNSARLFER